MSTSTVRLRCALAAVLFYEPDGLLLSSSLIPLDAHHGDHLLAFQLSYLGTGDLAVNIAVDGGPAGGSNGDASPNGGAPVGRGGPGVTPAVLRGAGAEQQPGICLTSLLIPDTEICYQYTVWGQDLADEGLRGILEAEVSGLVPLLTVNTRASVTRDPPVLPVAAQTRPR